jgi:diacylglycerol kinase family enzyme
MKPFRSLAATDALARALECELRRWGVVYELVRTRGPGDATDLARRFLTDGADALVAVGGDGTVAEVLSALVGTGVPLGIVPRGTGNQLAMNLGIPKALPAAVAVALAAQPRPLDVGNLDDGRVCALNVGVGWAADLMLACPPEFKRRWGFAGYVAMTARLALRPRRRRFRVVADELEWVGDAATVLATNCPVLYVPGSPLRLRLAPDAAVDDGRFDLLVAAPRHGADAVNLLLRLARDGAEGDRRLWRARARTLTIEADPPAPVQRDGDPAGTTPLRLVVEPGAAHVRVPPAPPPPPA